MNKKIYSYWFLVPLLLIYVLMFIVPTFVSFFFSLTVWRLTDFEFVGFQNFKTFFTEPSLNIGMKNTFIYAILTSGFKVILALPLAVLLTSKMRSKNIVRSFVFFPNLVSTVAVGITFSALMHPTKGLFNAALAAVGISGPDWLGNVHSALYSVVGTDVWKGVGVATVIYMAGIQSISPNYYEAAAIDGANAWDKFWNITLPLCRPSMNSVIILSFISGLRTFDLIWTMTKGGPGFATDTLASIVYKQFAGGYYGLSTAGNVIMFLMIALIAFPLYKFLLSREEAVQ